MRRSGGVIVAKRDPANENASQELVSCEASVVGMTGFEPATSASRTHKRCPANLYKSRSIRKVRQTLGPFLGPARRKTCPRSQPKRQLTTSSSPRCSWVKARAPTTANADLPLPIGCRHSSLGGAACQSRASPAPRTTPARAGPKNCGTSTLCADRKSTRLNSSHGGISRMPSSA